MFVDFLPWEKRMEQRAGEVRAAAVTVTSSLSITVGLTTRQQQQSSLDTVQHCSSLWNNFLEARRRISSETAIKPLTSSSHRFYILTISNCQRHSAYHACTGVYGGIVQPLNNSLSSSRVGIAGEGVGGVQHSPVHVYKCSLLSENQL